MLSNHSEMKFFGEYVGKIGLKIGLKGMKLPLEWLLAPPGEGQ